VFGGLFWSKEEDFFFRAQLNVSSLEINNIPAQLKYSSIASVRDLAREWLLFSLHHTSV